MQNTYLLFKHDNFLVDDIPTSGEYDEIFQKDLIYEMVLDRRFVSDEVCEG